ncbi:MAG TPA: carboxypeptidase-like regulatory domain-containing protein, partial [Vicinamibacterales bacterium]|nr:carboxypeptidase-like regulatory domain-containing protein [Vicinamibacterales bacterium]
MRRTVHAFTALFVVATLFHPRAGLAQVTGSVAGVVRDSSGAVLPGATVTLKGPALQRESVSVTTNAEGAYRLQLVPPGAYDVTVELAGFTTQERRTVGVALNQVTTLDFTMTVGGVTEAVQV